MTRRLTELCLLLLASAALAGCGSESGSPLDKYLSRLARSLDRDIAPGVERLPPLPRARRLKLDLESGSIDLLDLLSLRDCELNITIGKSNSGLGKVASASQRLLLELEFLSLAPACIAALNPAEDAELIATLREGVARKQEQLPARIWNATLGGPEFRAFWKRPGRLGDYPAGTGGAVPTSLVRLSLLASGWLEGDYATGTGELESLLADVRRGDGGALLAALELQQSGLAAAAPALAQRLQPSPICLGSKPSPEGRVVDNVVRKFFIGEVQPWSVELARRRSELMPPVLALETRLAGVMPGSYREWSEQRNKLLASAVEAPREHARALAALLESCGLRPGTAPAQPG